MIVMSEVLDGKIIKALSVEQRQQIMKLLAKRPYTASEIAKLTGKHVTTIGQHLEVLEGSGLIRKKESTNKWVYYQLSDKGEHLFKPQFYSWVIVLSLSVVLMFIGVLRIVNPIYETSAEKAAAPLMSTVQDVGSTFPAAAGFDFIPIALITLGIFGICYALYRKHA
jgi:DNA-binding transcriptional ArsR family regulator